MDRNLYAPPAAPLTDPVVTRAERPWQVTGAVALTWALFGFSILTLLLSLAPILIGSYSLGIFSALGFLLSPVALKAYAIGWLNTLIARGRNWARIVLTLIVALGFIYITILWPNGKIAGAVYGFIVNYGFLLFKLPIELLVVVLLFTPRANKWFKAMR